MSSLKSPAGSASPDPHGEGGQSNDENAWAAPLPGSGGPGGSAKKRWLRQAISEETETTESIAGGGGSGGVGGMLPANANESFEHVTPLKKRRMARASLSSETSFTPPSTPTPTAHSINMNESNQQEAMSGIMMADKEESSIELLSADSNSQATPPECDDVVTEAESSALLSKGIDQQPNGIVPKPPAVLAQVTSCTDPNSSSNGLDTCESSSTTTDEGSQTSQDASNGALPAPNMAECAFSSPTRLTWEFRAPDAQFMRPARQSTDVSSDAAMPTTDTASTPTGDYTPKPIKRKVRQTD